VTVQIGVVVHAAKAHGGYSFHIRFLLKDRALGQPFFLSKGTTILLLSKANFLKILYYFKIIFCRRKKMEMGRGFVLYYPRLIRGNTPASGQSGRWTALLDFPAPVFARWQVFRSFWGAKADTGKADEAAGLSPGNEDNTASGCFSPEKPCCPLPGEGILRSKNIPVPDKGRVRPDGVPPGPLHTVRAGNETEKRRDRDETRRVYLPDVTAASGRGP